VITAGLQDGPVTCSRGVVLLPDTTLEEATHGAYDMVVLPGGLPGADHLKADPRIARLLSDMAAKDAFIAAICAAPKVLASAGLLHGREATSYPGALKAEELRDTRLSEQAVVRDGKVITSRGPGTAMDFALALIEALAGRAKRDAVEGPLVRP